MEEKLYKTMARTGTGTIVIGIVTTVVGIASGVVLIVAGANLLRKKSQILF